MFTSGFCLLLKMSLAYGLKYLGVTLQNEVRFSQAHKNSQFFVQSWWMTISVLEYWNKILGCVTAAYELWLGIYQWSSQYFFFLDLMFLDMLNIHLSQLMQLLVCDALIYILFILLWCRTFFKCWIVYGALSIINCKRLLPWIMYSGLWFYNNHKS